MSAKVLEEIHFKGLLPSAIYGISVWGSCNISSIAELENVHIRAAKLIHKIQGLRRDQKSGGGANFDAKNLLRHIMMSCLSELM